MAASRMIRCINGHVFDAATSAACPVCGWTEKQTLVVPNSLNDTDQIDPHPARWMIAIAVTAALVVAAGTVIYAHRSNSDCAKDKDCIEKVELGDPANARRSEPEIARIAEETGKKAEADQQAAEAEKTRLAEAKRQAETKQKADEAARQKALADQQAAEAKKTRAAEASQQAETKQKDDDAAMLDQGHAVLEKFLTLDPDIVAKARAALGPSEPSDTDPALDALSPTSFAEVQLRLSHPLRHVLAGARALKAYRQGDVETSKRILTVLASDTEIDAGHPASFDLFVLGYIEARKSTEPGDFATGAKRILQAAQLGFSEATAELANDGKLAEAAGIEGADLNGLMEAGGIQDPTKFEPLFATHKLDMRQTKQLRNDFMTATTRKDWAAIAQSYLAFDGRKVPTMDATLALALLKDSSFRGPYDRVPVGLLNAVLDFLPGGAEMMSYVCEHGLGGVAQDPANAAVWLIVTLGDGASGDKSLDSAREAYRRVRQTLSEGQRTLVDQIAVGFNVP